MLDGLITHSDVAAFAADKVNLKSDDVADYRKQVQRLRDRLETYIADHPGFDLIKMLHSGSVAKGTALKTLNDMDVAVYVRKGKAPEDEATLLNWTAERLKEAYRGILNEDQIKPSHHCVAVEFRGSGLNVDVVPVLYEGGANDRGYLIPPSTGIRVLTSIPLHLEFIRKRKNEHRTHYRQMVRLVKWWARSQKSSRDGFRFKSFMTELLLAKLVDNGFRFDNYAQGLFDFFSYIVRTKLADRIIFEDYYKASEAKNDSKPIQIFDPVNHENNIAALYSAVDRDIIVEAAEDALDSIAAARRATTKGDAVAEWQQVLGTSFKGT